MSCCPPAPPIKTSNAIGFSNAGQESDMQPGESIECYGARAGNQTGKLDDFTELAENKIDNTAIPVNATDLSVNVTFKLTSVSTTPATSWTLTRNGSPWVGPPNFVSSGATATLIGNFSTEESYEVLLTAFNGVTQIDARTFKFSTAKKRSTNSIQFVNPLPGGVINSRFGLRVDPHNPGSKTQKMHDGLDFKMENRSVVNVVSAADGKVVFKGVNGSLSSGYGNCVKIEHRNGSGELLCTTVYAHLAKFYVEQGQTVSAGQKIGLEGTTGSSTGNHLHFECRLPNNTKTDPMPYFRETIKVTDRTLPSGDPNPVTPLVPTAPTGAAITSASVAAQSTACPAPGVDPQTGIPAPTPPPYSPPPSVSADPFERAWYFTMTYEVGPHWLSSAQYSPGDAELDAGLIGTQEQRKKCGYKPGPNFPGGNTKFGIAQDPNKGKVVVNEITYDAAKSYGKTNYWSIGGITNCNSLPPLVAIMIFDLNFLHGPGNARSIYTRSGQVGVPGGSQAAEIASCEAITNSCFDFLAGMNPAYINGWKARTNARLAYVKSLPYPLV